VQIFRQLVCQLAILLAEIRKQFAQHIAAEVVLFAINLNQRRPPEEV
jgi:hypothetical protein